ncbi:protein amalgam-like [Amyelois transitella]|uniref:protein amalgam-like n=1 Tax=Amyelois transitella TaxID=680683 RepID=UPI00067CB927|nr:protein amalgam-like [Amyelois transitella]
MIIWRDNKEFINKGYEIRGALQSIKKQFLRYLFTIFVEFFIISVILFCGSDAKDEPTFKGPDSNVTVVVGRDATLTCTVENLQNYKVAWLRVDTQTVLTIGPHVITKNHRVGVIRGDPQVWALTIRDVRLSDAGDYMCQVNTEPMITQTHHLHIAVPPDIVSGSNGEVMVREGDNVSLHCDAAGTPQPTITWRREDSMEFKVKGQNVSKWSGVWLNLTTVMRHIDGAFLCIATNGIPPSVSKRILLHVLCKPSVIVSQKMIGGYLGESVVLQCKIEANPTPVIYWTHLDGYKLQNGSKYQAVTSSQSYRHVALIRINNVSRDDIGPYHCTAENSLGTARDDVTLYTLVTTTVTSTSTVRIETTLKEMETTTTFQPYAELEEEPHDDVEADNFVVVLSQQQMQNLGET